jgi:hypothetical protein
MEVVSPVLETALLEVPTTQSQHKRYRQNSPELFSQGECKRQGLNSSGDLGDEIEAPRAADTSIVVGSSVEG